MTTMTETAALMMGLGLGLRHAADPDHLAAISTLLHRDPGPVRAVRVATLWGLGHSASVLSIGLLVVLLGWQVPAGLDRAAQGLVAGMLMAIGVLALRRPTAETSGGAVDMAPMRAPLLIGMVHGLAGSAALALLVTATLRSPVAALLYLGLFGVGTILGMATLTLLLTGPIRWSHRHRRGARVLALLSGGLSFGLGLMLATELFPVSFEP